MYMYQQLKKAVMGASSNTKSWSPNSIKAIVITRSFIFVAYHIRQPKIVTLDLSESIADIQKNGSGGALHNLLSQKQLSCLEEVYVDSVFQGYAGLMDLQGYVDRLISTVSRLRFYGFIDNADVNELYNNFSNAMMSGKGEYSFALDSSRRSTLQYQATQNDNWYSKYNLRPDKYSADSPKGTLNTWFKKVEGTVNKKHEEEFNKLQQQGLSSAVCCLFKQDLMYLADFSLFLKLRQAIQGRQRDAICNSVRTVINKHLAKTKMQKISIDNLQTYLTTGKIPVDAKSKFLIQAYQKYGILNKDAELNLEELVERAKLYEGFLSLPTLLCNICAELAEKGETHSDDVYLMLYVLLECSDLEVINGDVKGVIKSKRENGNCVNWYVTLLLGLCGYTAESIVRVK